MEHFFSNRQSPAQKLKKSQKNTGDILTLNDLLYHKTYPGFLRCVFKGISACLAFGPKSNPGLPRLPGTFTSFCGNYAK